MRHHGNEHAQDIKAKPAAVQSLSFSSIAASGEEEVPDRFIVAEAEESGAWVGRDGLLDEEVHVHR